VSRQFVGLRAVLGASPEWHGRRGPRALPHGAIGLEAADPCLDGGFAESLIRAEPHVRNTSCTCLSPHPLRLHPETLGNLLSGQEAVHTATEMQVAG
jgi:hypothetical protein